MDTYKTNKFYIVAALVVIFLYLSPYYFLGQDAHVLILDNVDGAVVTLKVLAESGQIFGSLDATIEQIMNGLPRNTFGTEFNVQVLLYRFLPAFIAYVTNLTLIHLIAFVGMFLLLRKHFITAKKHQYIAVGVALAFALLPFWPHGGLTVAGQPLVLYAFLNIRSHIDRKLDWLILALVPFYSSLVFAFAFFLLIMGIWWLFDAVIQKKINWRFLAAIVFMGLIYLVVEYRLVYNTFFESGFVSIRSQFPLSRLQGKRAALNEALNNFLYGQFHAASFQQLVILPAAGLALLVGIIRRKVPWLLLGMLVLTGAISLWYGFWFYDGWEPLKQQVGLLREFNFSRFHWLHPLLWYVIFALAMPVLAGRSRAGTVLVALLLTVQIGFVFVQNEGWAEKKADSPTYRQFFAERQFQDIKDSIGREQQDYRVVSIGIHPSISQYNGFYTLDGYSSNYSLAYKEEFRQIIAPELDKSPFYRDYFDARGGSRCYMFVEKLMYNNMMKKDAGIRIEKLDINTEQLKSMGGEYILSALPIDNAADIDLELRQVFDDDQSAWRIYLYEVIL